MGLYQPPPYRVKRNGSWVWIQPPEREYDCKDPYKPLDVKTKKPKGGRRKK
jgi:hypothetical protein